MMTGDYRAIRPGHWRPAPILGGLATGVIAEALRNWLFKGETTRMATILTMLIVAVLGAVLCAVVFQWLLRLIIVVRVGPDWVQGATGELFERRVIRTEEIESVEYIAEEGTLIIAAKDGLPIRISASLYGSNKDTLIEALVNLTLDHPKYPSFSSALTEAAGSEPE